MRPSLVSALVLASTVLLGHPSFAETFNGPFIGAQAGWSEDRLSRTQTSLGRLVGSGHHSSVGVGGFAGYDYKLTNRFVIGAEAGLSVGTDDAMTGGDTGSRFMIDPKQSIDLSARAGYLIDDKTLVYGRAGYSNVKERTLLLSASGRPTDSDTRDAWLVGAGLEREVLPKVTTRLEYRYTDLSDGSGKWDRHQGLLGAAYHF